MLIPDNINPHNSIYFTGSEILRILHANGSMSMSNLYYEAKCKYGMSYSVLMLSLDWLYLINQVIVSIDGEVQLCS